MGMRTGAGAVCKDSGDVRSDMLLWQWQQMA